MKCCYAYLKNHDFSPTLLLKNVMFFAWNVKKNELAQNKNFRNQKKTFSFFLTGFFFWGGKMTGFLGRFWALIPFEIDFCHKESKFCRVCPKGGYKNFLWSRRFWFWSRGRVRICFVPKTLSFCHERQKMMSFCHER